MNGIDLVTSWVPTLQCLDLEYRSLQGKEQQIEFCLFRSVQIKTKVNGKWRQDFKIQNEEKN